MVCAGQVQMGSTTPDGDVLGILAVAMSKHDMMMPYLSLSKQTTSERSAVVLLCTHLKTSFAPKMSDMKLEMAPELIDHEMRARADMLALAAATKAIHVSPAALACAVVIMAVPGYTCSLRTLLLRVTLAGDLACLKELIEIYLHMWKSMHQPSHEGRGIYASIFLDCMPYAIVKRRHWHLAELLKADLRAMQTKAEWTVRTNQPDPDGICTKSGLDKRFTPFGGKTLLMIACGAGDATCAEMLLTGVTGPFMNPEGDNDGSFTMKSITMRSGVDEVVRQKTGKDYYEGWGSPPGDTALMIAVNEGTVDCARLLLKHGADVTKVCKGRTAIMYACDKGRHEFLELLLAHKATVSQGCLDYAAFAGVHDHPQSLPISILLHQGMCFHDEGHARCLQILLERGLVPKERLTVSDGFDAYPLHLAAVLLRSNCVRILAAAAPQFVNRADNRGYTPLLYALGAVDESGIKERHADAKWPGWSKAMTATVAALLEAKADPELDIPFHTPLFLACGLNGSVECTRMLLDAGANPARISKHEEGYTSVHSGILFGELECIRMILDHKPDVINVVSKEKNTTPLALACQPNLHYPGIDEYKPDHKPEQFVALLLDSRADVRITDSMGRTALHHVANQCDWNALEGRADRTGAAGLIEMVLKNNPDVDAIDTLGKTALMLACSRKHSNAVSALLAGGASVNLSRPEGTISGATDKTTALMYAVKEGTDINRDEVKDPIVPLLLAHNADPNAENPANETALTLAAMKNSQRDIEYLVKAGARVNHTDNRGKTPMHHLARWNEDDRPGTADAIRLLSQHDANPDAQDNNGCSPLIIATRESNCQEVVRALLEAAADPTLVDEEGKTALMYARSGAILRMLRGEKE